MTILRTLKLKVLRDFIVPHVKRLIVQSKTLSMSVVKMVIGEVGKMNITVQRGIGCITKNRVCISCQVEVKND